MSSEEVEVKIAVDAGMISDLDNFQNKFYSDCKMKYVQFSITASRTIDAARKKVKRYLNPELKFYSIHWTCIHGGRQYKSRGKGLRKTMTLRHELLCPAHVHIIVSDSGNDFIVSSVCHKHNHLVSQALFKQLPHNRKLHLTI